MTPEEALDFEVCQVFRKLGLHPKLTRASGQPRGDGDVTAGPFMAENKFRSTKGFSVSKIQYDKAVKQARKQNLDLVFFRQNVSRQTVVLMPLATWVKWMVGAFDGLYKEES